MLTVVWFLCWWGFISVLVGVNNVGSGFLLVILAGTAVIGSEDVVARPDKAAEGVEDGLLKVKMMARGKQRRIAQRRESGVGGSMVSRRDKMMRRVKVITTAYQDPFILILYTLTLIPLTLLKMPRPGPRPYECVRRAWHSDRHQPIRGSLIQEIFRIVNEVHSSATRKNREWQEKLPIVVLKAEEIMYSKANSEAEYSDLKTLWDRVNDAINTIIRKDESTETGELLQPCIEAALHLGCTPRRLSRSQRNDSPRYYLRPEMPVATSPASNSNAKVYANQTTNSPLMLHCPQYSTHDTMKSLPYCLKTDNHNIQSKYYSDNRKFPVLPKNFALSDNHDHHASPQTYASTNTWPAYPLYYNNQTQPEVRKLYPTKPSSSYSRIMESDNHVLHQNLYPSKPDALECVFPSNHEYTPNIGHEINCDLTLRLGSIVVPCASNENSWALQVENGNPSTLERRKFKSCLNE
ncbi:hypothetical protein BUALT_Bualt10G0137500 [Buddleja alternifolia]|uniref:Uncharacterized protein n=1 Tax=Buddleja alternifolia TaxID=168488 RepID=A0AAV6WYL0_9LAMI|nr:hypothetical protein BUALT_Bualt10G0137500 [Buddleja alternifolia]